MSEDQKEDKDARKRRKEQRRRKREEYQNRLNALSQRDAKHRNPIIIEIVRDHLKKDIDVFQARWQTNTPLSNRVFLNTPLFWYKKHKWSHKDVKEFFKICQVHKENLDSELSIIWGIDETSKKKKKEKRKKLKEKHLRKESFASLLTLRHSSLRLMQERSMNFVQKDDPKADRASQKIWNLLVKNREENCSGVNHAQFNICLMDNNISVDPDMSVDLFYELIRTWEIIEQHRSDKKKNPKMGKKAQYKQSRTGINSIKAIGGSSAFGKIQQAMVQYDDADGLAPVNEDEEQDQKRHDDIDPPQKVKVKHIKKKNIDRQYIKRMLRHINKNIKREHTIANPSKLKKSKLLLVVFGKIFDAIQKGSEFDVQNDYISQALGQEQLNDPLALLEILETRDTEWKQRVQCLEYIESAISTNDNLDALFNEENFLLLIVGWTTQLYDERSRITQTAAELFPSLLTQLLSRMETPALIFEEENECLNIIFSGLFTLLKNKRAKTLADIAHDVLIETINILSTVAQDLDETAYYRMIDLLYQHTIEKIEKHEKVRAGCIVYSLFIVYGTESINSNNNNLLNVIHNLNDNPSPVVSDNEDEEEKKEKKQKPQNNKIAKKPQRAFLLEDERFIQIFAKMIENGIEDRSKETREKTMKALKKIESTEEKLIEKLVDPLHLKKFEKWKRFNAPKGKKGKAKKRKRQRISPIKRAKNKSKKVDNDSENEEPRTEIVINGTK